MRGAEDAMPTLEFMFTFRAELRPFTTVGPGPLGVRQIADVTGGKVEGDRIRGTLLPSGGDWLLIGPDGVARLDVRATVRTEDGAHVFVQYPGVLVLNEAVTKALAEGRETEFGDAYFFTQPRFETGDPRYAWLNSAVAIGEGRLLPGAVEYRVYRVDNERSS
jgi:hypothetical protein